VLRPILWNPWSAPPAKMYSAAAAFVEWVAMIVSSR
jgi:hypothetical protein